MYVHIYVYLCTCTHSTVTYVCLSLVPCVSVCLSVCLSSVPLDSRTGEEEALSAVEQQSDWNAEEGRRIRGYADCTEVLTHMHTHRFASMPLPLIPCDMSLPPLKNISN